MAGKRDPLFKSLLRGGYRALRGERGKFAARNRGDLRAATRRHEVAQPCCECAGPKVVVWFVGQADDRCRRLVRIRDLGDGGRVDDGKFDEQEVVRRALALCGGIGRIARPLDLRDEAGAADRRVHARREFGRRRHHQHADGRHRCSSVFDGRAGISRTSRGTR